jgi:hypothetical protein
MHSIGPITHAEAVEQLRAVGRELERLKGRALTEDEQRRQDSLGDEREALHAYRKRLEEEHEARRRRLMQERIYSAEAKSKLALGD